MISQGPAERVLWDLDRDLIRTLAEHDREVWETRQWIRALQREGLL